MNKVLEGWFIALVCVGVVVALAYIFLSPISALLQSIGGEVAANLTGRDVVSLMFVCGIVLTLIRAFHTDERKDWLWAAVVSVIGKAYVAIAYGIW